MQQGLVLVLDVLFTTGQRAGERAFADDFAHNAFRHVTHGEFGVAQVEEEVLRVLDFPLDVEGDVDDVLVARQHQAFFGHALLTASAAAAVSAVTDFDTLHAGHRRGEDGFDRGWQVIAQSGFGGAVILTEAQHDALFFRLDAVDARCQPQADGGQGHKADEFAVAATGHEVAEFLLTAADDGVEIIVGRGRGRAGAFAPWSTGVAASAFIHLRLLHWSSVRFCGVGLNPRPKWPMVCTLFNE